MPIRYPQTTHCLIWTNIIFHATIINFCCDLNFVSYDDLFENFDMFVNRRTNGRLENCHS